MNHPLRVVPSWSRMKETPNDSRVGVQLDFITGNAIKNEITVSENFDRPFNMLEFVREMMNIPGTYGDSTSGLIVDEFIIPPEMEYLVPTKTIIKQTFAALSDTSPFHRFLSAIPLGSAILDGNVCEENSEIGLISAIYHHAFTSHLVQNNDAHFQLFRCLAGNLSDNEANLIMDMLRPGGLKMSFRIKRIEPVMVKISTSSAKMPSRLTPGYVTVNNDLVHFMAATIAYSVPDFDLGYLSRLNIIKGVTIQKQSSPNYVLAKHFQTRLLAKRS